MDKYKMETYFLQARFFLQQKASLNCLKLSTIKQESEPPGLAGDSYTRSGYSQSRALGSE